MYISYNYSAMMLLFFNFEHFIDIQNFIIEILIRVIVPHELVKMFKPRLCMSLFTHTIATYTCKSQKCESRSRVLCEDKANMLQAIHTSILSMCRHLIFNANNI